MYTTSTIVQCYWLPQSSFNTTIPLDVNKQYIHYVNNSEFLYLSRERAFCYCKDEKYYDCSKDELGPIYPGQTLTVSLYAHSTEIVTEIETNPTYLSKCTVIDAKENVQLIYKNCAKVKYTIAFPTNNWCELILKVSQIQNQYNSFYIRELPCPLGFIKTDGICQCHPLFKQYGFTDCDINTQTILRPTNGWIFLNIHNHINDSFSCYISQQCPLDYCKPYPFYLNLSTPNSQCMFNRAGFLCRQCQ